MRVCARARVCLCECVRVWAWACARVCVCTCVRVCACATFTNSIALDDTKYRKIVVCAGTNDSADDLRAYGRLIDLNKTCTETRHS